MNTDLTKLLSQLPADDIRELLRSLYGMDKAVDSRIESRLLASDSVALAKHLKKRTASLKRGSRFISRGESSFFSRDMERLLEEIAALLPTDPKATFALAEAFMATHQKVLKRCDDSNGSVGDAYGFGRELWLRAALAWQSSDTPCKLDWQAEVVQRHSDNDYGMWDGLIAGSAELLSEAQLREMAQTFEVDAVRLNAERQEGRYCSAGARAELGMCAVAEALGDVALFAHSYRCTGGEPNELQREHIVKFCLAQSDGEAALQWLGGEWASRYSGSRGTLMDQALVLLGRSEELLQLRRKAYEADPSAMRLEELLAVAPTEEHDALVLAAASKAGASDKIWLAVDTLLALGLPAAAAQYVEQHPERLSDVGYNAHLGWAATFEEEQQYLATVLCYRILLLEILAAGRIKAYSHAAKYYRALSRLDRHIQHYRDFLNAEVFEQQLRSQHGQKRSFWGRVS